jgi:hypothetical protein
VSMNFEGRRLRVSPATVIALLALIIALSAPAQAAVQRLANGSVGTAQLKNGAVTTPKIRDRAVARPKIAADAVTGAKIANGSVRLADLAPGARPKPPRSLVAPHDDSFRTINGSGIEITKQDLPRGQWFVVVKGIFFVDNSNASCALTVAGDAVEESGTWSPGPMYDNFALVANLTLPATRSVGVRCGTASTPTTYVGRVSLNAVEVR